MQKKTQFDHLFEMERYHEYASQLELAVYTKVKERLIELMKTLAENIESLFDFTRSLLYKHLNFKTKQLADEELDQTRQMLMEGFEQNIKAIMKDDAEWEWLKETMMKVKF